MELQGKKVLVVGLAKTGIATAYFLLDRGARVTISEAKPQESLPEEALELDKKGVLLETGGHQEETFVHADLIVVSPGVPLEIPPLAAADARGIKIVSEIELAGWFLKTPLIAVTGTNGKTTATSLLGEMFRQAGKKVFVGGNIGTPLIAYVSGVQDCDYVIAEISSFQLEGIATFRPRISVMLNITEDHLDRYRSFADYIAAKRRLFMNQKKEDRAVLNFDDPLVRGLKEGIQAEPFFFSATHSLQNGVTGNSALHIRYAGGEESFSLSGALLQGAHNLENMMAAAAVGYLCGLPVRTIQHALVHFRGLAHRMEFVDEIRGVRFYNDSKGTNVGAVVKSLESLTAPLILIAGGKDKGGSYAPLKEPLRSKVKALILLGEARERIFAELGAEVETHRVSTLDDAVALAFSTALPGDTVLFSPACSSFDMFTSYAHRGECFCAAVKKLKN